MGKIKSDTTCISPSENCPWDTRGHWHGHDPAQWPLVQKEQSRWYLCQNRFHQTLTYMMSLKTAIETGPQQDLDFLPIRRWKQPTASSHHGAQDLVARKVSFSAVWHARPVSTWACKSAICGERTWHAVRHIHPKTKFWGRNVQKDEGSEKCLHFCSSQGINSQEI